MGSEEAPHPGGGRWVSGSAPHKVLGQLFTLLVHKGGVLVKVEALADVVEEAAAVERSGLDCREPV